MTVRVAHEGSSAEGANSTYLLAERGVVIDPARPGERAWATVRDGLADAGMALEAVEHVIVTHWHMDHAGLAPRLAEAADAEVHMHEVDAPLLAEYAEAREARVDRDAAALRAWDVPEEVIRTVVDRDTPSAVPDAYPVTAHTDGDRVAGLELHHTPGHTAGHLAVSAPAVDATVGDDDADSDGAPDGPALFVGDAVLPTYSPNVGGSDTRMADPLSAYLDTLDRVEALAHDVPDGRVWPGHGATLDLAGRIAEIRAHHEVRCEAILDVLGEYERVTPWRIARELFGEMESIHAKLGAGEAASHLTYLAAQGVVEQVSEAPDQYVRVWDAEESLDIDAEP